MYLQLYVNFEKEKQHQESKHYPVMIENTEMYFVTLQIETRFESAVASENVLININSKTLFKMSECLNVDKKIITKM